jgi:hypothetical protein
MSRPASSVKLFVGQIGRTADDAELRALLEPFGSVLEVSVIKDKATGQSKGVYGPSSDCFPPASAGKGAASQRGGCFVTFYKYIFHRLVWRMKKTRCFFSAGSKKATVLALISCLE